MREEEIEYFKAAFGDDHLYVSNPVDQVDLADSEEIDTLCVFVSSTVDKAVMDQLPNLTHIATRSTGADHINVDYAKENDIAVSNVPAYGEETVAEFTFALLLALARKIFDAYHQVREGRDYSYKHLKGFDLNGKTLGVVGTGKIGANVIEIASGFNMNVLAYDVAPNEALAGKYGFTYTESLNDLLKSADIVTLHVPYNEHTRHLIGEKELELLKDGAYLINTSRGEVIDTKAMIQALEEGKLAGAALDVLEGEHELKEEAELVMGNPQMDTVQRLLEGHVLIDMPNVIVTPHIGFYTKEAEERILQTTKENIAVMNESSNPKFTV